MCKEYYKIDTRRMKYKKKKDARKIIGTAGERRSVKHPNTK